MKNDYLICCLVVAALCFGQLASNLHIVGHLGAPAQHVEHGNVHGSVHGFVHEKGHSHQLIRPDSHVHVQEATQPDAELNDCAIYHIFAGTNGLTAIGSGHFAAQSACALAPAISSPLVVAGSARNLPIRGPPSIS